MIRIACIVVLAAVSCARAENETGGAPARALPAADPSPKAAVSGYQIERVVNGGGILVKVLHSGEPKVVKTEVTRDQETCGTVITTPTVDVTQGVHLHDAIVFIENVERGKAPDLAAAANIDNRGCHFLPRVQTMTVGQTLDIVNSDPILHNTHAYAGNRTVFNLALPVQGQRIAKKITTPGLMRILCDAGHTWMEAWIYAFHHPYHAVTDMNGKALITDVPAGTYKITAWHEILGMQTENVTVEVGKVAEMSMSRLAKPAATTSPSP
jgi:plastocyanin